MKWTQEATEATSKVPFFVRGRVKKRVEEEARASGSDIVTMGHVNTARRRYLKNMEDEVKGWQLETCFGPAGCPNRAVADDDFAKKLETCAERHDIRAELKKRVKGQLKLHHEFRISVSDCPNCCSRPQIADIGLIGALEPKLRPELCNACGACIPTCREGAIKLAEHGENVELDFDKCLACGQCLRVCAAGALTEGGKGYRIQVGGKLGRHPQLARELKGIYSTESALNIVNLCITRYVEKSVSGERFGEIINRCGIEIIPKP